MEEASCPLPALEAAFRDGREFLAEPLRSKRVHADCGAPGALKTDRVPWKPRPGVPASGRIAEPLLRSASAPPSFRRGRAGCQLQSAEKHSGHGGDASPVLPVSSCASLGWNQDPAAERAAPPPRL